MAITVFLAGGNAGELKSFVSDAVISVKEDFSNDITSHPVDSRSNISDHVYNRNPRLTIIGSVSNNPIYEYPNNEVGYNGENRADKAHELLKILWYERSPFKVITEFDEFDDCILSNYSVEFTSATMEALNYTCDIEVIRRVSSQSITITTVDSAKIGESGKGTSDNGADQATDLNDGKNHAQLPPAVKAWDKSRAPIEETP